MELKNMRNFFKAAALFLSTTSLLACAPSQNNEQIVNIYSERHYDIDQVLYDQFEAETGIKVNVIQSSADDLIVRMQNEGADTSADILIVADAGRLERAKALDLLQSFESNTLNNNVPNNLRDDERFWYGLTTRARVIVYHVDRVNPSELSTYEDLTSPKWKNRLVMRSSTSLYNQSFTSAYYAINGEAKTLELIRGLVANLAQDPRGNDRDQARFVASGIADVAIMNTYYLGRMLTSTDAAEKQVAEKIGVFFPNQITTGTHVNISGAGISKHAKNQANAIKLLEFLSGEEAQDDFANVNFEYPVNPRVEANDLLKSWGSFKAQDVNLSVLGEFNAKATMLMNEGGWR
jgi:iron(III) transport system substrate-binding protein